MLRIACLGECMLELAAASGHHPRFGFGGDTLNTAVYMARQAGPSAQVAYVTALGNDPFSDEMLNAWAEEGLNTEWVTRLEDALPGLYVIRTDTAGERSFYYWREQAAVRSLLDQGRDEALREGLARYDLLYLSGITLALFSGERRERLLALLRHLSEQGTAIAFDTNYRPRLWRDTAEARTVYEQIGPLCRFALPGLDDLSALFGDSGVEQGIARWLALGAREVVLKCGSEPCHIAAPGAVTLQITAETVSRVVDTTAAGDAFAAAYLVARLGGEEPASSARQAHALAARVITHPGAIITRE